ncbi:MAG TPA: TylF/MycF/NovP-related O-methyltransferase [Pyrinomonadaceae bacterium]|nr:TylF/MycF/NovP-related O-methyltransferase [Pyrinomonadaceae bacterium]
MVGRIAKKVLPQRLVEALRILKNGTPAMTGMTYDQDGLSTIHNCDFMNDPAFIRAYGEGEKLNSWFGQRVHWRVHTLFWAASRALQLEGDLVECGVNNGGFSRAIAEYIDLARLPDRRFYLLDNFAGISEQLLMEEEKTKGILDYSYTGNYEAVVETFGRFENVVIIKGDIPDTLVQVKSSAVSFLSIDLNCAAPEIAAAEYFWEKLVSGAAIVLDDYGWAKHIVQKRAFDEFAQRKNVPILSLPTGQGLIIKP